MAWNSEILADQANALAQVSAEHDPQTHTWGMFSWGDAPGGIGGGVGCFQWFDSCEDLLSFLTDYCPALYTSFEQESDWLAFRERLLMIAVSNEDAPMGSLDAFNSVLKGLLQIDWIGRFDELCASDEQFCSKLRSSFRDNSDTDESSILASNAPIQPEEIHAFCEMLQDYGF